MSVPSVVTTTRPSPGNAVVPPTDSFRTKAVPLSLSYPHLHSSVVRRPVFDSSLHSRPDIFSKIIHPYNTDAFELLLGKHNLLEAYPDLVRNLREGFPIGPMPLLAVTNILKNHPSVRFHALAIDDYLADEVSSGRMDGPFSRDEVERIVRGPFQSSPLIVAVQTQAPGEPDKIRICRNLSKSSQSILSVNSFIKTVHFPTRFDTAVRVAEVVSFPPRLGFSTLRFCHGSVPGLLPVELCIVLLSARSEPAALFLFPVTTVLMLSHHQLMFTFICIFSSHICPHLSVRCICLHFPARLHLHLWALRPAPSILPSFIALAQPSLITNLGSSSKAVQEISS